VKNGTIAAVTADIAAWKARTVVDVSGLVVTPGLVDIHVHVYSTTGVANAWAGDDSVRPDDFSFRTGVTTMADAGTAGWQNFGHFRETVIDRAPTRVFAFVNIARLGMMTLAAEQYEPDERGDDGHAQHDVKVPSHGRAIARCHRGLDL
jgi:dihydroorotase